MPFPNVSVQRLNQLLKLNSGTRYLEIGVSHGETLMNIAAPIRVAVDPFMHNIDKSLYDNDTSFHEVTSDDYFLAQCASHSEGFDVIFIDGFHSFDQAYRDFVSSLLCLKPGGFILVDDIIPSDYFASMRNPAIAYRCKRLLKPFLPRLNQTFWMGDVYRLLLFIRHFYPCLEYATLCSGSSSTGQTLIWRRADWFHLGNSRVDIPENKQTLKGLMNLAKTDYFWLQRNRYILNSQEDDYLLNSLRHRKTK